MTTTGKFLLGRLARALRDLFPSQCPMYRMIRVKVREGEMWLRKMGCVNEETGCVNEEPGCANKEMCCKAKEVQDRAMEVGDRA